jgi:hypothetical protein
MQRMKKFILLSAIAMVSAFVLVGCEKQDDTTPPPPVDTNAPAIP